MTIDLDRLISQQRAKLGYGYMNLSNIELGYFDTDILEALKELRWYREQDLIRRDWVLTHRNCTHEECLKKNRDCNNCSYNVVEVGSILRMSKVEPPKENNQ